MKKRVAVSWMTTFAIIVGGIAGLRGNEAHAVPRGNRAPQISGTPAETVLQSTRYRFRPTASDANHDPLTFAIANKPDWAAFDRTTGRLSGTPHASHVGTYSGIRISVTDGRATSSLPTFGITVTQSASGSVTLSWSPPRTNADGSPLRDLAGYRIYLGLSPNVLNRVIVLNNSGLTRYVVDDLTPARWHFALTSVNTRGQESQRTPTLSRVVG